jgi:hypothetical protein
MIDEALQNPSSAAKHTTAATPSISKMERTIAELEARLTPAERLEYYECIAQGELRVDVLTAILSTR